MAAYPFGELKSCLFFLFFLFFCFSISVLRSEARNAARHDSQFATDKVPTADYYSKIANPSQASENLVASSLR